MCCISVCDLIRVSCSRFVVYLLQLAMITLAAVQLIHPNAWTYSVLFKNGTNFVADSIKESIKEATVDVIVQQIPLLADTTTVTPTLDPNATTTSAPMEDRPSVIFWCLLLGAVNLLGLFALLCEVFIGVAVYSMAALAYLVVAASRLHSTGSNWYLVDVVVWSLILFNCLLELVFQFAQECCGCRKEHSLIGVRAVTLDDVGDNGGGGGIYDLDAGVNGAPPPPPPQPIPPQPSPDFC